MEEFFKPLYGEKSSFCYYSSDFLARFGVCRAIAMNNDHILFDEGIHRGLKDGAFATRTKGTIMSFGHHDYDNLDRLATNLRANNPDDVIAITIHDFYVQDSTFADIKRVFDICVKTQCMLIIDVCDSLFFTGEDGFSKLKSQISDFTNVFLVGAGTKAVGANFGFMALSNDLFAYYMTYFSPSLTFSNAIPPSSANIALYNVNIITTSDGVLRRRRVLENGQQLFDGLKHSGFEVLGEKGYPIINVKVGSRLLSRAICNLAAQEGLVIAYSEYPEVPMGESVVRFNCQAHHSTIDIKKAIKLFTTVYGNAKEYLEHNREGVLAVKSLKSIAERL